MNDQQSEPREVPPVPGWAPGTVAAPATETRSWPPPDTRNRAQRRRPRKQRCVRK